MGMARGEAVVGLPQVTPSVAALAASLVDPQA